MFRVTNTFYCRYLLPNMSTRKTEGSQMFLPYRSYLEISSLITKLLNCKENIADTLKDLLIYTRSIIPVNL